MNTIENVNIKHVHDILERKYHLQTDMDRCNKIARLNNKTKSYWFLLSSNKVELPLKLTNNYDVAIGNKAQ